jgi:hypothetical protein
VLAGLLKRVPEHSPEIRNVRLGLYRGLRFGLVLHPFSAPEVFLEGASFRNTGFLSESHGARAVLNAVERLADDFPRDIARAQQELVIAEGQLRDYQAQLGKAFPHAGYLNDLTALRDQLKANLTANVPAPEDQQGPTAAELAEKIKALKASQTIEAMPQRPSKRRAPAGRAVTARLQEQTQIKVPEAPLSSAADVGMTDAAPATGQSRHGPQSSDSAKTEAALTIGKKSYRDRVMAWDHRKEVQATLF